MSDQLWMNLEGVMFRLHQVLQGFGEGLGETLSRAAEGHPTLRDLYALHAPEEVPGWFEFQGSDAPPLPEAPGGLSDRAADLAFRIRGNEIYDIGWAVAAASINETEASSLRAYRDDLIAALSARQAHAKTVQAQRFIAWRWHYADLMLAARGNT